MLKNNAVGNKLRSFAAQKQQVCLQFREPRLTAIVNSLNKLLSDEGLKKLEKNDQKLLQKAQFHAACLFKQKRVLDIGCNVGAMAIQIAALYDPTVVIGVDVDPVMITAAIGQMHRVINDQECARIVKEQISADAGEDRKMLTEEEQ